MANPTNQTYRLAELAGSLSLAGDAADGFPQGKVIRTAALAVTLAELAGIAARERRAAYFTTLVRFLGCTGFATEEAHLYSAGDDITLRNVMAFADSAQPLRTVARVVSSVARNAPLAKRARAVGRLLGDPRATTDHARAQCDTSLAMARAWGLGEELQTNVRAIMERWDGRGAPERLRHEQIPLAVQLLHVADVFETTWHRLGFEAASAELARRRGGHLSPALVDVALRGARELLSLLEAGRDWEWFLECEPAPHVLVDEGGLARVAQAAGRLADLKSSYTLGHSERVAQLGCDVLLELGASSAEARSLALAGHLHDLGRMGVPNAIWDKPGPLSRLEREQAESHTLLTERILRRAPALEPFAALAAAAHERIDGSGYHRRLPLSACERPMRVLAVADVVTALGEPRPHRPARAGSELQRVLGEECSGLDANIVEVALDIVASRPRDRRRSSGRWPNGLTDREVEVLRVVALGKSNAEAGVILGISARTVQNHLASAYAKLGVESRGGAALFMMEHGLLG